MNEHSQCPAASRPARRVLIVDDHPVVRQGLRHVLEDTEDLIVCGEADTAIDARTAIEQTKPDVLICDIGLRRVDGIELVRCLRSHHPRLPILVLSALDEAVYAERMLALGVCGYIMKQAPTDLFLMSLRRVLDGQVFVSDAISSHMLSKFAAGQSYISADPIDRLTNRELQILHMIGRGTSTRETAKLLHLSIKTIESHRQRIKRKLNLSTAVQLLRYAILSQAEDLPNSPGNP
jgi:DNA-binding NarL/FixJ family response regulator